MDGGNTNKPPYFNGEYYDFLKIQMRMHLEAQDDDIWDVVKDIPFVPITVFDNISQSKI